jgi:hypothetical protein
MATVMAGEHYTLSNGYAQRQHMLQYSSVAGNATIIIVYIPEHIFILCTGVYQ